MATQWSLATRPDPAGPEDARAALVQLCRRFWYPVYAYLRRCGHAPDAADGLVRAFLQHLLDDFREGGARAARGQFRPYLLERLNRYLASPVAGGAPREFAVELAQAPAEQELRYLRDGARAASPEQAYQQSFALELLDRAIACLRREALQTGRAQMYDRLEPYLAREPASGEYQELARDLRMRPLALVVALKRLRQRFRELIDADLAETVGSADEFQHEQQALRAVLSGDDPR
jgi:RNA polymerase sigma-70 factor (ECF subfamily)